MEKENQNKCPINIFTFLSVDESYHRNASCVLNWIYTFLLLDTHHAKIVWNNIGIGNLFFKRLNQGVRWLVVSYRFRVFTIDIEKKCTVD